jgi:hypothetical protein
MGLSGLFHWLSERTLDDVVWLAFSVLVALAIGYAFLCAMLAWL